MRMVYIKGQIYIAAGEKMMELINKTNTRHTY